MQKLVATVICQAIYTGSIDIPDGMTKEEAIQYAKEHIKDIPIDSPLEYVTDSDILDEENCVLKDKEVIES